MSGHDGAGVDVEEIRGVLLTGVLTWPVTVRHRTATLSVQHDGLAAGFRIVYS